MSAGEADLSVQITGQANNMACHSRQGTYLSPKEKLEDQNGWSDRTNLSLWAKLGDEMAIRPIWSINKNSWVGSTCQYQNQTHKKAQKTKHMYKLLGTSNDNITVCDLNMFVFQLHV